MNRKQRRAELKQNSGAPSAERARAIFNEALSLHQSGRLKEAEARYRDALRLDARQAASLHMLGLVLATTGRSEAAIEQISAAIALEPNDPKPHNNLGLCFKAQGDMARAIASYRSAVALDPGSAEVFNNLGDALRLDGRPEEAIEVFQTATHLQPAFAEAHHGLGLALIDTRNFDGAIASFRRVIALKPDHPAVHINLGMALSATGALDEAIGSLRKAVQIDPASAEAQNNLGAVLRERGRLVEAETAFRRAIDLRPDFPDAHANLATSLLTTGQFAAGWPEYEWRWETATFGKNTRYFARPQWRGEAAEGRTLLIHAEQGFGDTIQFCRYIPFAVERGFTVIVEVQAPLRRLLETISGVEAVITPNDPAPTFDLHIPMLSLPGAFKTELATIPPAPDFVRADRDQTALWKVRVDQLPKSGLRVGLAWAGNPNLVGDQRRSIPFEHLEPILTIGNVQVFSLQKDGKPETGAFPLIDYMSEMADFADTAALIENLDLVISVDTAIAHLAAAMGKPVWLLNRYSSCHRWLLERDDSPWYPTLRLYRQKVFGDWAPVLDEVAGDLARFEPNKSN